MTTWRDGDARPRHGNHRHGRCVSLLLLHVCVIVVVVIAAAHAAAAAADVFDGFAREVPTQLSRTRQYESYYDNHDAVALAVAAAVLPAHAHDVRRSSGNDNVDSSSRRDDGGVVLYGGGVAMSDDDDNGDGDVIASVLLPFDITATTTTTQSWSHVCAWSRDEQVTALRNALRALHMPAAATTSTPSRQQRRRRGVALVLLPRRVASRAQRVDLACLLDAIDAYNDAVAAAASQPLQRRGDDNDDASSSSWWSHVRIDAVLAASRQLQRRRAQRVDAAVVVDTPRLRTAAVLLYRDDDDDNDDKAMAAWQRVADAAVVNERRWARGDAYPHFIVEVRQPMRLLSAPRRDVNSNNDDASHATTAPVIDRSCLARHRRDDDDDDDDEAAATAPSSCACYGGWVIAAALHDRTDNNSTQQAHTTAAATTRQRAMVLLAPSTTTTLTHGGGGTTAAADGVVSGVVTALVVAAALRTQQQQQQAQSPVPLYVVFVPAEVLGRVGSTHVVRTAASASGTRNDSNTNTSSSWWFDHDALDAVVTVEQVGYATAPLYVHVDARVVDDSDNDSNDDSRTAAAVRRLRDVHGVQRANTTHLPHSPTTSFVDYYCSRRDDDDSDDDKRDRATRPALLTLSRYDTHYRSPGVFTAADDADMLSPHSRDDDDADRDNDDDDDDADATTLRAIEEAGNVLLDLLLDASRRRAGDDAAACRVDAALLRRLWRCLGRRVGCDALTPPLLLPVAHDYDTATVDVTRANSSSDDNDDDDGDNATTLRASERALAAALRHVGLRSRRTFAMPPQCALDKHTATATTTPLYVRSTWPCSVGVRLAIVGSGASHAWALLLAVAWCAALAGVAAYCARRAS